MTDIFDRLFWHPTTLARHRGAPFVKERMRYLQRLVDVGASDHTLRGAAQYTIAVSERLRLADSTRCIDVAEIRRRARRLPSRSRRTGQPSRWSPREVFTHHAIRWLRFLNRFEPEQLPLVPHRDLLSAYLFELQEERGLSSSTIEGRRWWLELFLRELRRTGTPLRRLKLDGVDQLLLKLIEKHKYGRATVKIFAGHLRDFFRFLHRRGESAGDFASSIKGPHIYSQARLPTGPSWKDVERLVGLTDTTRPTDIRDRAILLLLAMYGLRGGEVVRLRLEDFDWERELLFVRRTKSRARHTYPLVSIVGHAVIRYLKEVRPPSHHREVFLLTRAPFGPLRTGVWRIVSRRLRAMGLVLSCYGPHSLRHACATHLLAEGFSLKEIGDHLGHRLPQTTRVYANVDLAGLREIAEFNLRGLL